MNNMMEFKQKKYGTFDSYPTRRGIVTCCGALFVGCIMTVAIGFFLLFTIGFDTAIIVIGTQHGNTTCDDNFHTYRLSQWLIIFGSVNLSLFMIYMFIVGVIICISSSEKIMIPVMIQTGMTLIWIAFSFTMAIVGIIELAHVFPKCIVEEYALSVTVLVVVILKLVFMCGAISNLNGK
jgi:hypothetical protein